MLIGLTLATGLGGSPQTRRRLVAFHEQTALASLIAIALHGVALLPDKFLKPGLDGLLIPFAIDYRPAYVAAGIVGGYLAALLGLSFYARRRIGGKRWRNLHRATPVVYVLGLVHTLGAGTDAGSTWLQGLHARHRRPRRRAARQARHHQEEAPPGADPEGSHRMRIVLVGAGLAAQRCAEALRTNGHDGPITMIGAEKHAPYDRPPLSKAILAGERPDLAYKAAGRRAARPETRVVRAWTSACASRPATTCPTTRS